MTSGCPAAQIVELRGQRRKIRQIRIELDDLVERRGRFSEPSTGDRRLSRLDLAIESIRTVIETNER